MVGLIFHTIGVSDGISMGTEGMKCSLLSRDIIADSIETVMRAQWYDANVSIPGCDKNMPGTVMAMARVNRPSIVVYGGTIRPGHLGDQKLDIVSAFEAYGQWLAKEITEEELKAVLQNACPGAGACGGMYTANTMASAIETLGMSLPYSSSIPATSREKRDRMPSGRRGAAQLAGEGHQAAGHPDARGLRERHHRRHGAGRLDQRGAASDRDGQRRRCAADHRRLPGSLQPHAAAGGPQAERASM